MKKFYSILTVLAFVLGLSQYGNAQCDTLRNWNPALAQPYQIVTGAEGYVPGHETIGTDNILRWAEPYFVSTQSQVRAIRLAVHNMQNPSGNSNLTLRVWSNNAGSPGTVLGSQVVDFDDINPGLLANQFVFNVLEFVNPVTVNGSFFVGYELDYTNANDTLGVVSQLNASGATNTLHMYDNIFGWDTADEVYGANVNSVMDVLLSDEPTPTVDFVSNSSLTICDGGSWELDGSSSTNMTEWNWELWSLDGNGDLDQMVDTDNNGPIGTLTPNGLGDYAIFLFSGQSCVTEIQGYVGFEIFPLPNVEANASETLVCSGEEVTLTATGSSISYDWSGVGTGAVQTVNPTATQNYIVTGTDANGCQNTDQVNVAVNPLPSVNAGSNITVCEGTEVTLTANAPTATTVSWTGGVVDGEAFTPAVGTTTYTVTVEDANGCENSDDVNVTVEQGPATNAGDNQTTCVNYGPISLSGTPTGGTFSGPGVANNEFDPAAAGVGTHEITYVVQSSAGCDGFATMSIVVDECLSVNDFGGLENLILMPNPARDYVDIVVSENVNVKSIEVIAVTGQVVTTSVASNGNTHRVDLSSVNTGAYFVRITSDDAQTTRKIVVK